MAVDKSIKADYAIQGGGPNYLGKQEMVRAPKKWQSSPDHEPAELAYITEKEKDILLDLNIYGSLKNGKHLCNIECAKEFNKIIEVFVDQNYEEA